MKFGFLLPNYGPTASGEIITGSARLAEDLGYDSVWTTDHVLVPSDQPVPYGNLIESLMALTIAATATRRVQLGTSIIVTPLREPILLAKQLAALDVISGGRLIFGAGAGWLEPEFRFLSADFSKRGKIMEEYLRVLRALWRGENQFQGEFTSFADALFSPLPLQGDRVPLWLGGNSRIALQRVARIADAWHPVGLSPNELAEGAATLRSLAQGRSIMVTLRVNVELPGVGGMDSQISAATLARSYILRGNPEALCSQLAELQQAGLEYLVMWFFHANWQELEDSLTIFAHQVMPFFR